MTKSLIFREEPVKFMKEFTSVNPSISDYKKTGLTLHHARSFNRILFEQMINKRLCGWCDFWRIEYLPVPFYFSF